VVGNENKVRWGTESGVQVEEQDTVRWRNGMRRRSTTWDVRLDVACVVFFLFSVWCGWGARRPDALLASDVWALAIPIDKLYN